MSYFCKFALYYLVFVISDIHGHPGNGNSRFWRDDTSNKTLDDAVILREAIHREPIDEKTIGKVITKRPREERLKIAEVYRRKYGGDFVTDLTRKLVRGDFRKIVEALMKPRFKFYAEELNKALNKSSVNVVAIIDIIGTMDNAEIASLISEYEEMYERNLLQDIKSGVGCPSCTDIDFVLELGRRYQGADMNRGLIKGKARELIVTRWSDKDSVFHHAITTYSYAQLRKIFIEFAKMSGYEIKDMIGKQFTDRENRFVLGFVRCIRNKAEFFAERIHRDQDAVEDEDYYNNAWIRIIVARSDIDLTDIKKTFAQLYGESLEDFLKRYSNGNVSDALVALVQKSKLLKIARS